MVQNFKPQRKDDEIRVKMDITVDLPAEVAKQAEQMGIYEFERCVYDPDTRNVIKLSLRKGKSSYRK